MKTPQARPQAFETDSHHMFWRAKDYRFASRDANRLRLSSPFILNGVVRWRHDHLHEVINPLPPPSPEVCNTVYEIGLSTSYSVPQIHQIKDIIDVIAEEASREKSFTRSDELMRVAFFLNAQVGVIYCGDDQ